MRWFWIDRFTEFVRGTRATAVKSVSLAEEQMDRYFPGLPVMPASLIIEGIAQTAGLTVGAVSEFRGRVVLAKVGKAVFHDLATPGDTLTYRINIESLQDDGAVATATVHKGNGEADDGLVAEVEIMFAQLDDRFEGVEMFDPYDFLVMLRLLHLFDVGVTEEGQPLPIPEHMASAEAARR